MILATATDVLRKVGVKPYARLQTVSQNADVIRARRRLRSDEATRGSATAAMTQLHFRCTSIDFLQSLKNTVLRICNCSPLN